MANIHVKKDPKGLERGSGGTEKTVGIGGGGLSIDIAVDRCYADARARWEAGLPEEGKEAAIQRERATHTYYTSILMEGDPDDYEGSLKEFADKLNVLQAHGWEVNSQRFQEIGRTPALFAELKRKKTSKELAL